MRKVGKKGKIMSSDTHTHARRTHARTHARTLVVYEFLYFQIYLFLGTVVMAYAVAFVVSLTFESPMMGLEKALLGRKKNS